MFLFSDHRVRTSFAEGYAAIDILTVYPEDAGVYTLRVANAAGEAFTSTTLHCVPAPQPYPHPSPVQTQPAPRPVQTQPPPRPVQTQPAPRPVMEQQISQTQTVSSFERQASVKATKAEVLPPAPAGQSPVFTQPLQNVAAKQGTPIHLESRLIPVGDSTLSVIWYKDGQPLQAGARFKTTNDWGHVALDIVHSYPEDTGRSPFLRGNLVTRKRSHRGTFLVHILRKKGSRKFEIYFIKIDF